MRRFVFAAFALTVFAACQPVTNELTEEMKAEIAAEVNALNNESTNAWREADVDRGMSYYRNSPEFTFAVDGQLITGFSTFYDMAHSGFANIASQTITVTESQTTVLAPDVVCTVAKSMSAATDTLGATGPESAFVSTNIWMRHDGEWKIQFSHLSSSTPETP